MIPEIVTPKNNEEEFIHIASRLGIGVIYFLYNFDYYDKTKIEKMFSTFAHNQKIKVYTGLIVNQKNIKNASTISKFLVVKSSNNDRSFIESNRINLIYGLEETYKRDFLHQRASGLNHILCELVRKNKVIIGFSYSSLLNKSSLNTPTSSLIMGRMMQNIKLCKKYKCAMTVASFTENPFELRSPYDVRSLFRLMGMTDFDTG